AATSPGSRPWMVRRVAVGPQGSPALWRSLGSGPTRSLDARHVPVAQRGQGGPARARRLGRGYALLRLPAQALPLGLPLWPFRRCCAVPPPRLAANGCVEPRLVHAPPCPVARPGPG